MDRDLRVISQSAEMVKEFGEPSVSERFRRKGVVGIAAHFERATDKIARAPAKRASSEGETAAARRSPHLRHFVLSSFVFIDRAQYLDQTRAAVPFNRSPEPLFDVNARLVP